MKTVFVYVLVILALISTVYSKSVLRPDVETDEKCDKVACIGKCEHYCHDLGLEPNCEYMGEKVGCICVCHHGH
ncbi:unnamed protein product [Bursaphelenchus okinawaensis]|uniref:Invertebrate defensins family profile domain-containing protein n=1 Tax=Bursaphelenchus okinawaensis TaxID=465554 RepID=A0A811LNF1_9BILA|nr:unnamed protein product [Bursaphelenchus okinawaensis]CAG9124749.1 unnamed protein product [Bursaphelenchus okinawaensis]